MTGVDHSCMVEGVLISHLKDNRTVSRQSGKDVEHVQSNHVLCYHCDLFLSISVNKYKYCIYLHENLKLDKWHNRQDHDRIMTRLRWKNDGVLQYFSSQSSELEWQNSKEDTWCIIDGKTSAQRRPKSLDLQWWTRVLDNSYLRFKVQFPTSDSTETTAGGPKITLEGPVPLYAL